MPRIGLLENVSRDVLYALRTMRRNPAFAVTVVLTLALGIGANTAIFSVIRAVLLKPLAYPDPDRLVWMSGGTPVWFEEMRSAARSFSEIGAFLDGIEKVAISGVGRPEVLRQARVSGNFLEILGVQPLLGRGFRPEEDAASGPRVAIISEDLWQRWFSRAPLIIGQHATLEATSYTIIGVLPAGFQFPFQDVDVWVTRPSENLRPQTPMLAIFGRLKTKKAIEQASAELAVLKRQYATAHPGMLDAKPNSIARVTPLKDQLVAKVRTMLWMLFGAVGFVLLIVCANVASLILARSSSRLREFAVRASLGATRGRLFRQLQAESIPLALCGGILGLLLGKWSLGAIASITAFDLPRAGEIRLDAMVMGFAALISIGTGVLFGMVPALSASRPDLATVLKAGGEAVSSARPARGRFWFNARGALVSGQVALSTVLLIGAALLLESLAHLYRVDPGFKTTNLLTMQISLPRFRYNTEQKKTAFYEELVRRMESLPGVRNAAVSLTLPMTGFARTPVQVANRPLLKLNERHLAVIQSITPTYFRVLEIPLMRGREFSDQDVFGSDPAAIINDALARLLWPAYPRSQDPIGEHILIGVGPQPVKIVGVVADMHQNLETKPWPGVFRPYGQSPPPSAMLAVRTTSDPLGFANAVRGQVQAIDPDQPVSAVRTMDNLIQAEVGPRTLMFKLLALFSGTALLITVVGIYGITRYWVVQRTRELGIRRALGAQEGNILGLVIGQGLGLAFGGVFIGVAGALALTRVMKAMLFDVSATDPSTFVGVGVLLMLLALIASYIPARRVTRIDPVTALRDG